MDDIVRPFAGPGHPKSVARAVVRARWDYCDEIAVKYDGIAIEKVSMTGTAGVRLLSSVRGGIRAEVYQQVVEGTRK